MASVSYHKQTPKICTFLNVEMIQLVFLTVGMSIVIFDRIYHEFLTFDKKSNPIKTPYLKARIWASRLGSDPRGQDISFERGWTEEKKEEKEKFPLCVKA